MTRITVPKTYKLYINGAFPRSERGRVLAQHNAKGDWMANYCWSTRKDFRNAMVAARAAQTSWAKRSAFNRSQIIYRIAETLDDRHAVFVEKLVDLLGIPTAQASQLVSKTVDLIFYYAGWADKYGQVLSSVNPVSQPFFNFTTTEPTGVVTVLTPVNSPLLGLAAAIMPIILSGNSCIAIVENVAPTLAIDFAEVVAVSDVPNGVINLLTGKRDELVGYVAGHMDLNALVVYGGSQEERRQIGVDSAENVKRCSFNPDPALSEWLAYQPSLYAITPTIEYKTAWHPIGV